MGELAKWRKRKVGTMGLMDQSKVLVATKIRTQEKKIQIGVFH